MLIDDIRFIERNYTSLLDVPLFSEPWHRIKDIVEAQNTYHNTTKEKKSILTLCPHHIRNEQCIWGLRGCCSNTACHIQPKLRVRRKG